MEPLWRLSGTHPDIIFFFDFNVTVVFSNRNPVNREIARFLSGQTPDRRTDGRTDRTNCLTPPPPTRRGVISYLGWAIKSLLESIEFLASCVATQHV